ENRVTSGALPGDFPTSASLDNTYA
ncbi:MAG: hypothetical protein K0Q62_340, partial [Phenylobacterium sp.]|nr:hypothetical protein [Phenylobacterium sp.]